MSDYTERDIARGLNALLAFGGAPALAQRALKDAFDLDVPRETLKTWRDSTHAERYVTLQEEHGHDIEQAIIRETRDLARAATQVERMAIDRAMDELADGRVRATEAAQIALNMTKIKQTNIDKMLALTGRPQQITENRSLSEILRALQAKGLVELEAGAGD